MQRIFIDTALVLLAALSFGSYTTAYAGDISAVHGVAIEGYNPLSYFTKNKALRGSKQFSLNWQGQEWYFSTAQEHARFAATPEKFKPEFAGFCANGLSQGHTKEYVDYAT